MILWTKVKSKIYNELCDNYQVSVATRGINN